MSSQRKDNLVWGNKRWPICPPRSGSPDRYWWHDSAVDEWVLLTESQWNTRIESGDYQLGFTPEEMIFAVEELLSHRAVVSAKIDWEFDGDPRSIDISSIFPSERFKGGRCRWIDGKFDFDFTEQVESAETLIRYVWDWKVTAQGFNINDEAMEVAFNKLYDQTDVVITWDSGEEQTSWALNLEDWRKGNNVFWDLLSSFINASPDLDDADLIWVTGFEKDPSDSSHPRGKILTESFSDTDIIDSFGFTRPNVPTFATDSKSYKTSEGVDLSSIGFDSPSWFVSLSVAVSKGYLARESVINSLQNDLDDEQGGLTLNTIFGNLTTHLEDARQWLNGVHSIKAVGGQGYDGEALINSNHSNIWSVSDLTTVSQSSAYSKIDPNTIGADSNVWEWEFSTGTNWSQSTFDAGNELIYALPDSSVVVDTTATMYFRLNTNFRNLLWDAQTQTFRVYFHLSWLLLSFWEKGLGGLGELEASVAGSVGGTRPMTAETAPRPDPLVENPDLGPEYRNGSDADIGDFNQLYPFGDMDAMKTPFPEPLRSKFIQYHVFEWGQSVQFDDWEAPVFYFAKEAIP